MPSDLTPALDAVLDGLPADALRRATASLIEAYRSGAPPTQQVLHDPTTAAAYAAYRMPATHAAVSTVSAPRASAKKVTRTAKPAALGPTERNAVTGVGAPS